jgi:protein-S-isoprenylcysteine O-methyltransferase Ste14
MVWLILLLWIIWFALWARSVIPVPVVLVDPRPWLYVLPLVVCDILLANPFWPYPLTAQIVSPHFAVLGVAGVMAGLGLALWSRRHLGRYWTGPVGLYEGQRLVQTGPYRRIRHPIYTGLLLAFSGTALAIGQPRGLLAVGSAGLALSRKIFLEEKLLAASLPDYAAYRQRTGYLLPKLINIR